MLKGTVVRDEAGQVGRGQITAAFPKGKCALQSLKSLKWWNRVVRLAFSKDISGCYVKSGGGQGADWRQDFTVISRGMRCLDGPVTEAMQRRGT